ncbi:hypothetical protein FRC07_000503 [Ceratobasidium sp. 392]|nr:hypothetical protein FRC07_000503 [Ceratobasidium sp. 392]
MKVLPNPHVEYWSDTKPPPFSIVPGKVGIYQAAPNQEWSTLQPNNHGWNGKPTPTIYAVSREGPTLLTAEILRFDNWLTYKLPPKFEVVALYFEDSPVDPVEWQDFVAHWAHARKLLPGGGMLESTSRCSEVTFQHRLKKPPGWCDNDQIYYHRCPTTGSDPRNFWGYFSTNKNPDARTDDLENQGWELKYGLYVSYHRIADDWGYMYRKLLKESLDTMPGSFPTDDPGDSFEDE